MNTKSAILTYPRLCIAYFCLFAIWGAWAGPLGGFAASVLKLQGWQIASLYSAIPLGAVIAPLFIGPIADRFFSAQKVIAVLHFIGGVALVGCGIISQQVNVSFNVLMVLMLISGICYMPSIGLVNSVVFKHLPNPSLGPFVFVFGTIGWIAVNLFIAAYCNGAETPYFFFVGGGIGIFLAIYSLTLPDTPPKGASETKSDMFGLGALGMLKDPAFAIFVICAFMASIPACNYFFPSMVPFLSQRGYNSPVALTTLNQFSEILLMTALPFFIARIGLKPVLLIGMAAWAIRYVFFAIPDFGFAIAGLLLHGFCYTFLYVAAYMYADKKAPEHLKSSAQSMMVFLLLGVGQVLGGYMYGFVSDAYPPRFTEMKLVSESLKQTTDDGSVRSRDIYAPIPAWSGGSDGIFQYLDLAAQVSKLAGKNDAKTEEVSKNRVVDFGKILGANPMTPETIEKMSPDDLVQDNATIVIINPLDSSKTTTPNFRVHYTKHDLTAFAAELARTDNFSISRTVWIAAQSRDWTMIYLIPAGFIGIFFVIFLVFGREPADSHNPNNSKPSRELEGEG